MKKKLFIIIFCSVQLIFYPVICQPASRNISWKEMVLNKVFSVGLSEKPYIEKYVFRFGDTYSQMLFLIYDDNNKLKCDAIIWCLDENSIQLLNSRNAKTMAPEKIATQIKPIIKKICIDPKFILDKFERLKKIRISPALAMRACLGICPRFDFWYDNWAESVNYSIIGKPGNDSQDKLTQWMFKVREDFEKQYLLDLME